MFFNSLHQYLTDYISTFKPFSNFLYKKGQKIDFVNILNDKNKSKEEIEKLKSEIKNVYISGTEKFTDNINKIELSSNNYTREKLEEIIEVIDNSLPDDNKKEAPKLTVFSNEEIAKRRELSNRAREKFFRTATVFASSSLIIGDIFGIADKIERQSQTMLAAKSYEDYEKSMRMMNLVANPTKENEAERKEFVTKKILDCIKLSNELKYTYTDEEFIDKYGERLPDIFLLTELQKGNISKIEKDFGITLDDSLKDLWTQNSTAFVQAGYYLNRIDYIANQNYAELDLNSVLKFYDYYKNSGIDEDDITRLYGFHDNIKNSKAMISLMEAIEDDKYLDEGEEKTFTPESSQKFYDSLSDYSDNTTFCGIGGTQVVDDEHPKHNIVAYNQENVKNYLLIELKEKFGINELKDEIVESNKPYAIFKDLVGNVLSADDALDRVLVGKNVMLCDNLGNELRYFDKNSFNLNWGTIENPDKYPKFNLESDSVDTIKNRFRDLLNDLNEGTHWYMRSSDEYRNLRTSVSELLKTNYDNPSNMVEKINEIKENAKAYIVSKEDSDARITKRTEPRIDACNKLINVITNSIQEPKVIECKKTYDVNVYLRSIGSKENIEDVKPVLNEKEMDSIDKEEVKDVYNNIMKEEVKDDPIEKIDPAIDNNALSSLEDDSKGFEQDVNFEDIESYLGNNKEENKEQVL